MNKHKNHKLQKVSFASLGAIIASIVLLVILFIVLEEKRRLDVLYRQQNGSSMTNYYKVVRITFCYNNNLRPCTDAVIEEWNKSNPDERFSTVVPSP